MWPRYHTEVTASWFMTMNVCEHVYSFVCFATPAHFSPSAPTMLMLSLFGKHPNTEWICSLFVSAWRLIQQTHFLIKALAWMLLGSTGACPVPSTLHPHSHHFPSLPLLLETLQGQQNAAWLWLLWLCQSQQESGERSGSSTLLHMTIDLISNLFHTFSMVA